MGKTTSIMCRYDCDPGENTGRNTEYSVRAYGLSGGVFFGIPPQREIALFMTDNNGRSHGMNALTVNNDL